MSSHEHQSASSPSTMKSVIALLCLASVALAAPQSLTPDHHAKTIRDERVDHGDGNFNYAFAVDNGIETEVAGSPGPEGAVVMRGYYIVPLESGGAARVEFVADTAGFQPSSDLIPTPHPLPEHVHELLRIAEEFERQGVQFDEQGHRVN
ncbi:cuticle protein AMP2-like [Macrobrachium rosenbergii]|uniref:cuticle protein AMP2-like n=1 Tax=Macrobrachium rosenbergii TaxID=79674 RepID=UPI0034D4CD51